MISVGAARRRAGEVAIVLDPVVLPAQKIKEGAKFAPARRAGVPMASAYFPRGYAEPR